MKTLDRGVGVRAVLRDGARGRVLATYRKAFYLRCDAGVVAVTDATAEPGPIHVRCPVLPTVAAGEQVVVRGNELVSDGWRIGLDAPLWTAALPSAEALREGLAPAMLADVRSPRLLTGDVPTLWPDHAESLRAGDLPRAAEVLGGHGPGLTPAGDDVLAGLLLVASALRHADLEHIQVRTNSIAASYLHWAARGHSIAPAHDLLNAYDSPVRARPALDRLQQLGASSGSALAYGIALALRFLPAGPIRKQPLHTSPRPFAPPHAGV